MAILSSQASDKSHKKICPLSDRNGVREPGLGKYKVETLGRIKAHDLGKIKTTGRWELRKD